MQTPLNRIAVFADGPVGARAVEYLADNYRDDIKRIVFVGKEKSSAFERLKILEELGDRFMFFDELDINDLANILKSEQLDYILLAWWPYIIKEPVLSIPSKGILNFHPSLLPFNRGKHYNFWTIVEGTPFGVTIHFINKSVDSGDIVFQKPIFKTWEDTGASLYEKAQIAIIELFKESYPKIRIGDYTKVKQIDAEGTFHLSNELENASKIDLDGNYKAKDLLNILRARTFPPHPGAWFEFEGDKYEIRVQIKKL